MKRQAEDSDSVQPVQRPRFQPRIPAPLPTRRETPVLAPAGQADGVGGGKQQDGVGGGGKGSCKQQEDGDTVLLAAKTPQRKRVRYNTVRLAAMYYAECKKAADAAQPHSQSHSSQPSGISLQSPSQTMRSCIRAAEFAAAVADDSQSQSQNDEAWG